MNSLTNYAVGAIVFAGCAAVLAGGCQDATQVHLVLSTDIPCSEFESASITVGNALLPGGVDAGALQEKARTVRCNPDGTLGDLYIIPSSEAGTGSLTIRAARKGVDPKTCLPPLYEGCIVARRTFSFQAHQQLELPVKLLAACIDEPCTGLKTVATCVEGRRCVDTSVSCDGTGATGCVIPANVPTQQNGSPCPAPHAFCADFDPPNVEQGWDVALRQSNGTLSRVTDRAVSKPGSAEFRLPRHPVSATSSFVNLIRQFTGGMRRALVEFDIYIETPVYAPNESGAGFLILTFRNTQQDVNLTLRNPTISMSSPPGDTVTSGAAFPFDQWVHARVDVDPIVGKIAVTLGNQTLASSWDGALTKNGQGMSIYIGITAYGTTASPDLHFNYDNVTVDFP